VMENRSREAVAAVASDDPARTSQVENALCPTECSVRSVHATAPRIRLLSHVHVFSRKREYKWLKVGAMFFITWREVRPLIECCRTCGWPQIWHLHVVAVSAHTCPTQ
jgi:hypothetical protein